MIDAQTPQTVAGGGPRSNAVGGDMVKSAARAARRWIGVVFGVLVIVVVAVVFAAGAAADGTGTIATNQPDYAPSDSVALSGSGWTAGETVSIVVDDDQSDPWNHAPDLTAAEDGSIFNSFTLPDVAGTYTVTATAPSGSATAGFTVTAATEPTLCAAAGGESLSADQSSYAPGEVATFTGSGFSASCDVVIRVTLPDASVFSNDVGTDADGNSSSGYTLPDPAIPGEYLVEALGVGDAVLASARFTGTEPPSEAAISSDKSDYAAGETVTLTGTRWQSDEAVHIFVNDNDSQSWSHDADVVAGAGGGFTYSFDLPAWFVATYAVTATGASGTIATTTFTDSLSGYFEGTSAAGTCTSPSNALTSNNVRATCTSGQNVVVANFGLQSVVPSDATSIQFNVEVEANDDDEEIPAAVSLSWDGGVTNFTSATNTGDFESNSDVVRTVPSTATSCQTFGRTWLWSELSDANFRVRVAASDDTVNIDRIRVRACWAGSGVVQASVAGDLTAFASPSALLRTAVQVNHTGSGTADDWFSTQYTIQGQSAVCQNTPDFASSGTDTAGWDVTTPPSAGTYDITYVPYTGAGCTGTAGGALTRTNAITVGIFGDSFGIADDNDYSGASNNNWSDEDGGTNNCAVRTRTGILDPNGFLRLRSGCTTSGMSRAGISTSGLDNIHLRYEWGQDTDGDSGDDGDLIVEWKRASDSAWQNVNTHDLGLNNPDTNPVAAVDATLSTSCSPGPTCAANTTIDIRFRGVTSESDDQARVDDVLVAGAPAAPANTTPTADPQSLTFDEDSLNNAITLTGNANDAGQTLTFYLDSLPANGTLSETSGGGTATVDTALADANLFFTPNGNYCTTGNSFEFYVKDSSGAVNDTSLNATISVRVTCLNDPPVNAVPGAQSTDEDMAKVFSSGNSNQISVSDVDLGAGTIRETLTATNGTITLSGIAGLAFTVGDGTADATMTFTGTLAAVNTALNGLSFTPTLNFNGAAGLQIVSNDQGNTPAPAQSDTDSVTIDVTAVNDAPVCVEVSLTTDEDSPGSTSPSCTDVDDDVLSLTYDIAAQPTNGVASVASLDFDPYGEFEGLDDTESDTTNGDFTYTANDGDDDSTPANVQVTVNGVNDAPECDNREITTDENTAGMVAASCTDVDVEPLTITVTQPSSGLGISGYSDPNLTFDPNTEYESLDTGESDTTNGDFTYTANDGTVDSNTADVAVEVTGVNDAPVLTLSQASYTGQYSDPIDTNTGLAGLQPIGISATDADDTGAELTFTVTTSPACTVGTTLPSDIEKTDAAGNAVLPGSRTASIEGRFDTIPAAYVRCIVVSDGTGTDTETLTLNVNKENASVINIGPDLVLLGLPVTETGTFVEENDGYPSSTLAAANTHATAYAGTNVKFDLAPVGAGTAGKNCTDTGVPVPPGSVVSCSITLPLASDVYEVNADIQGSWFDGTGIGTLAVYDPNSGFATGGGNLLWNGWKVNFGFVGKQVNKSFKGSILTVIHKPEGPYVVKSNAFTGLAINQVSGQTYWYVSMTAKATYAYPDGYANPGCSAGERKCGNFAVLLYAEDVAEPGAGVDKYRLKVTNPSGTPAFEIPLTVITGGNVQVPHK